MRTNSWVSHRPQGLGLTSAPGLKPPVSSKAAIPAEQEQSVPTSGCSHRWSVSLTWSPEPL